MTLTYSLDVATVNFGGLGRLLFRWKASIYKLVLKQLLCYTVLYYAILAIYRLALNSSQRETFEDICMYFRRYNEAVPMTFVLGFYFSLVFGRWWSIYLNLPWPDRTALLVNTYMAGVGERARMVRRTVVRYLNLSAVLCLRCASTVVKKRFPTLQHMVDAKLMTMDELDSLESMSTQAYGNYFQPIFWCGTLFMEARQEGLILDDHHFRSLMDEIGNYRGCLGTILSYDWISVPLAYTQVVALAVYMYFFGCLFGRQYLVNTDEKYRISEFIPVFTFVQFIFYIGWLKVAEMILNPLGEDDDDFELNSLIDRNVDVGFMMVDELHGRRPKVEKDPFWDDEGAVVPYTEASAASYKQQYIGSAADVEVSKESQNWADEEEVKTEEKGDTADNLGGSKLSLQSVQGKLGNAKTWAKVKTRMISTAIMGGQPLQDDSSLALSNSRINEGPSTDSPNDSPVVVRQRKASKVVLKRYPTRPNQPSGSGMSYTSSFATLHEEQEGPNPNYDLTPDLAKQGGPKYDLLTPELAAPAKCSDEGNSRIKETDEKEPPAGIDRRDDGTEAEDAVKELHSKLEGN